MIPRSKIGYWYLASWIGLVLIWQHQREKLHQARTAYTELLYNSKAHSIAPRDDSGQTKFSVDRLELERYRVLGAELTRLRGQRDEMERERAEIERWKTQNQASPTPGIESALAISLPLERGPKASNDTTEGAVLQLVWNVQKGAVSNLHEMKLAAPTANSNVIAGVSPYEIPREYTDPKIALENSDALERVTEVRMTKKHELSEGSQLIQLEFDWDDGQSRGQPTEGQVHIVQVGDRWRIASFRLKPRGITLRSP